MEQLYESRRDFIRNAAIAAASLPLLASCQYDTLASGSASDVLDLIRKNAITDPGCNWCGAKDVPASVSSSTVLSAEAGKGQPMRISGTVFRSDGKRPAPDTLIYLYHTDFEGYYGRSGQPRHGRYRGWLLTDTKGRYSFDTIKPAPYPENRWAAHIHMTMTGTNFREDWIDSILFEGDRLISQQERSMAGRKGGFQPILKLEKGKDGFLTGVRDIQLI